MTEVTVALLVGATVGLLLSTYGIRLFPKWPKGTYVVFTDETGTTWSANYVRRSSLAHHCVRLVPDPDSWYSVAREGGKLTATTKQLSRLGLIKEVVVDG